MNVSGECCRAEFSKVEELHKIVK
uniref:Uncharacterized protein n=1 Tax=Rhizophora mucronata TaxID=61149 RepID=A0A2P2PXU4_RHIMU